MGQVPSLAAIWNGIVDVLLNNAAKNLVGQWLPQGKTHSQQLLEIERESHVQQSDTRDRQSKRRR